MCEFFLKVMVQLRKILVLIIGIAEYVLWPLKKICFGRKNIFSPKYENKTTKLGVENRAQHASQRHLSVLKTDSNLASVPRRE